MLKRMFDERAILHEQFVEALQSSGSTSECLSREITGAVMGRPFHDRVNHQIQHIIETTDAIYERAIPITEHVPPCDVAARLDDSRQWMRSRSTMKSERVVEGCCGSSATTNEGEFGLVELFRWRVLRGMRLPAQRRRLAANYQTMDAELDPKKPANLMLDVTSDLLVESDRQYPAASRYLEASSARTEFPGRGRPLHELARRAHAEFFD